LTAPLDTVLVDYLMKNKNKLCTYKNIGKYVWGMNVSNNIIEMTICRIKRKQYQGLPEILNVRGVGYKMI